MAKQPKPQQFEELLARLQQIVETLDRGSVSLDEALALYEEGIGLAKQCAERLTAAETRLLELSKTVDGLFETRNSQDDEEDE
jgi:exodeoxyribonuclease VII small subunit